MKKIKKRLLFIITIFVFVSVYSQNTIDNTLTHISIDNKQQILSLNIPTNVFFKNNEYKRKIAYGYTLGGFRMIPNLQYSINSCFSLSVGVNLLRYWGANEYGHYNFLSVPYYTDKNIQKQLHWKPFFRFAWQINPKLEFVMGNIKTNNFHFLPIPLYNRELAYSSDGEEGLQIAYYGKYWTNEAWLNWQNFNFYNDVDRESFDLGISGYLHTNLNKRLVGYYNYSFIWHHNGGELDTISLLPLDHWANGHIGTSVRYNITQIDNHYLSFSFDYLFSKDMKNSTLPFKSGYALFPTVTYNNKNFNIQIGYYDSKDMITFYGTNFFSNLAQRDKTITYPHNQMFYGAIDYDIDLCYDVNVSHTKYIMSFVGEFFYKTDNKNSVEKETKGLSFVLGVVFRAEPKFYLKKFKKLN